jgi:hypothetical protein
MAALTRSPPPGGSARGSRAPPDAELVALTAEHRDAILQLLEGPQSPALNELRGVLANDIAYRRGLG